MLANVTATTSAHRARRTRAGSTLYLVSPKSLESWFSYFVDDTDTDEIAFIGERADLDTCAVLALFESQQADAVVVCSSHETLVRDSALGEKLRRHGANAIAPSATSASLGTDKLQMKEFFDRGGFPSPAWAYGDDVARLGSFDTPVVVKRRDGTQSIGTHLVQAGDCVLGPDDFCELYVDGVEYSVVLYRDEIHELVFPPVWKGDTSPELVPPWRRLRMCPDPNIRPELEHELRATARGIARAADVSGHLEVEYLATPEGRTLVLEINPRVAGTMRIAAMATRIPIFSLHRLPPLTADLCAVRCAWEVPYGGPALADPEHEIFATSRLTAAGTTFAEARAKIDALQCAHVA